MDTENTVIKNSRSSSENHITLSFLVLLVSILVFIYFITHLILTKYNESKSTDTIQYLILQQSITLSEFQTKLMQPQTLDEGYYANIENILIEYIERQQKVTILLSESSQQQENQILSIINKRLISSLQKMIVKKQILINYFNTISEVQDNIPMYRALTDKLIIQLLNNKKSNGNIYVTTRQLMLLERISYNLHLITIAHYNPEFAITAMNRFGRDSTLLIRVFEALKRGSTKMSIPKISNEAARKKLSAIQQRLSPFSDNIGHLLENSPDIFSYLLDHAEVINMILELQDIYKNLLINPESSK